METCRDRCCSCSQQSDPRTIHYRHQNLVALQFPTPGEYRLGLHAFGQVLFERRIDVRRRGDQES
jgi:hypothetical protein